MKKYEKMLAEDDARVNEIIKNVTSLKPNDAKVKKMKEIIKDIKDATTLHLREGYEEILNRKITDDEFEKIRCKSEEDYKEFHEMKRPTKEELEYYIKK